MQRLSFLMLSMVLSLEAQPPRALTAADYARAEKFLGYNTTPLALHSGIRATWLTDDRFWYRNVVADGAEFILFDVIRGTRQPAFDHAKLAAALSQASRAEYTAYKLPFTDFELADGGQTILFNVTARRWTCNLSENRCTGDNSEGRGSGRRGGGRGRGRNEVLSPDKKRAAFIRDFNLWVRDVASGKETQLTTDGVKDFGYATDNAGWAKSDRPIVLWSPDSKKIATFQQDQRGVGEMYLVETRVGHPILQAWKYPLPGDEVVTTIQRVIVDLDGPRVIRLQAPADQHRSTLCDNIACRGGEWSDVQWSPDSVHFAFVSTSRSALDDTDWRQVPD